MESFTGTVAFLLRMLGDTAHVLSMVVLVQKILKTRSASGLSFKTQLLKLIVFATRYLDIFNLQFFRPIHFYNFLMKILYLTFQSILIYIIKFKMYSTYEPLLDDFKIEFLLLPSFLLSIFFSRKDFSVSEIFYNFSVILESLVIVPQLVQLQKMQESETLTSRYILLLGAYRLCYTLSWFVIKLGSIRRVNDLMFACGIIQTALYVHFFFLFYGYVFKGKGFKRIPK
ncbi:hypothetical protein H312_01066 [Anncaliia algerae PRA339]|uniref:ER lumen protein-retaining receptor n=1 Tax=Anncaliia algerae PRA339 TaxID=1288291 RepID=A0A059F2J6_9MICR|nr:hypothetical protein H312_01066 [Anncaliia algerae PRA339]